MFRSVTAGTIAILLLCPLTAAAQDVTEHSLKAAYIYNFAKFTEWPADAIAAGEPLVLCVFGDAAIGLDLEQLVKGRAVSGHPIGVKRIKPDAQSPAGCHLTYISGVTLNQAANVVAGLRDGSVLTISDIEGFTKVGGIALFFFENGHLRFDVQLASTKRARLQISSKLLTLARPPK